MNTFLELGFDSQLCNRICLTLAHSLWQVSLLAAGAVLLVSRLRRDKPERGYAVYVGAMLLAIVALPITYWQLGSEMLVVNQTLAATNETGWPAQSLEVLPPREIVKPRADSEPVSSAAANVSNQAATSVGFAAIAPWLLGVYLLGVVVMLVRVGQGVWKAQRLASLAQPISSGPLVAALERLARSWSLRVLPRLAEARRGTAYHRAASRGAAAANNLDSHVGTHGANSQRTRNDSCPRASPRAPSRHVGESLAASGRGGAVFQSGALVSQPANQHLPRVLLRRANVSRSGSIVPEPRAIRPGFATNRGVE